MSEETCIVISKEMENQMDAIPVEKLPQVFNEQVALLEGANQKYKEAQTKEEEARKKVKDVLQKADALISATQNLGNNSADKKKFLWAEWTSKNDEIDALKENLKEIIDHSEDSAEAQKKLAEVQSSLMESQTAILQVQKAQMEYQRQIADATKFVFGLSAYNMATSQSVLIKLKAILSGASEEQLGELAQQQLFLALDQIRNQENLITRINDNDKLIENLNLQIEKKQKEIDEIGELDEEQNRRISANAIVLEEHEKVLAEQQEKDEEHDKRLAEMDEADKEQDKLLEEHSQAIVQQEKKDKELEKRLDEQDIEDEEQDKKIADNAIKIDEHSKVLSQHSKRDIELQDKILLVSQEIDCLRSEFNQKIDGAEKNTTLLEEKVITKIGDLSSKIEECDEHCNRQLKTASEEIENDIEQLKSELKTQKEETNKKIQEIESKIADLYVVVSKKNWKVVISLVAGISLVLNILQILGVL